MPFDSVRRQPIDKLSVATSPIKKPSGQATGGSPPGPRPYGPPQELLPVPRHATLPSFLDAKPSRKEKKKRKPSVLWPKIWKRLRHPSLPWVMAGGMAVVLAGILLWRRSVTGTPQYATAQVALAIRQHNGTKLAYYADGARFSEQLVGETTDWLVRQRGLGVLAGVEGVEEVRGGGRAAKVQAAKSAMTERLNRALGSALTNGAGDTGSAGSRVIQEFTALPPLSTVIGGDHLEIRAVGRPTVSGGTAEIPVTLQHTELQIDVPVALAMRWEGKRWRVVGIHRLESALAAIDNAQMEQLTIANRPVERQLATMLRVGALSVQRVAHGRSRTIYRLRVPITNASSSLVVGFLLSLHTRATDEEHATPLEVRHAMAPGATSTEVWQFDETAASGSRVAAMLSHPERLVLRVRSIVVDSAGQADTVRLFRNYRGLLESRK